MTTRSMLKKALFWRLPHFMRRTERPLMMSEAARKAALNVIQKHGLDVYFYLPAAGCADQDLANALRFLGHHGYLMTDAAGTLVGRVAKAQLISDERAQSVESD